MATTAPVARPALAKAWARTVKYFEIGKVSFLHHVAYVMDLVWRSIFLCVIVFVFTKLWEAVYATRGGAPIEGFDHTRMIWYFLTAEVIVLSTPRLWHTIGEQVRSGEVAYRLNKPYSFVAYHYAAFMAEGLARFSANGAIGVVFVLLLVGPIPVSWGQLGIFLATAVSSLSVHFCILMIIGLTAFWVEEPAPYYLIYQKALFILGGMLLPLEILPQAMQKIAAWLPLKAVVHGPARTLATGEIAAAYSVLASQLAWCGALACGVGLMYRKGVKRVNVNGG